MIENLFGGGGGGGGTVDTITAGTGISVNSTDPANPIITNTSLNTDETAKVSANDTTAGYLNGKLVAGSGITLTENNNGGNETLTIASTVTPGVTGFTGSQNTASPNNTVNASRLLVDAGTTNADAVIQPKGTGAFQLQLADGTATGGNKRGVGAIDLQLSRSSAAQVASGANSIAIGRSNTSSNNDSIAIGWLNTASGISSVAIGNSNSATASYSTAFGYLANATAQHATAIGVESQADRYGQFAYASGRFVNFGDAQYERYVLRRSTTTNTVTELSADGGAPQISTRIAVAIGHCLAFHAIVAARRTDVFGEGAGYEIKGVIYNNGGTTQFIGTPTVTVLGESTAAWDVAVSATTLNGYLSFNVTGENSKTIRWVATVNVTRVG